MRLRLFLIPFIVTLFAGNSLRANELGVTITVTVTNIPEAKGDLLVGLYNTEKSFTKDPMPVSPVIDLTSGEDVVAKISGVMPGVYAIAVVQDFNENGKLDKTIVGMPKEPLAFSVITEIPRGKPNFKACSFQVGEEDVEMTIALVLK